MEEDFKQKTWTHMQMLAWDKVSKHISHRALPLLRTTDHMAVEFVKVHLGAETDFVLQKQIYLLWSLPGHK